MNSDSYDHVTSSFESQGKVSAFGDALGQIKRLDYLYIRCMNRRERGDLLGVKWALDSAEVELYVDTIRVSELFKTDYVNLLKKINENILESEKISDKNERFSKLYQALLKKEKTLRMIQEKAGKGSKLIEQEEDFV